VRSLSQRRYTILPLKAVISATYNQCVILLESWKQWECINGDEEMLVRVEDLMPKLVKKRRK